MSTPRPDGTTAPPGPPAPAPTRPAETYSHGHHASVLRSHGWRTAENSAAYLLPHLRAGDHLLDVGVGPGTITADLATRVARVVGIDNAATAVQATRALAASSGLVNLTADVGEVYALDFPDATFDVVHAHQVLQHLADPVAALREMGRVCRPGGLVAVRDADYAAMTWSPPSAALHRWRVLYEAIARANGGEPDAGRVLKGWVEDAGFTDLTCTASAWCFATEGDLGWWSQSWSERLTASSFAASALDHGLSDADELAGLSAGWREWAVRPGAWFAVLHGEVLARA